MAYRISAANGLQTYMNDYERQDQANQSRNIALQVAANEFGALQQERQDARNADMAFRANQSALNRQHQSNMQSGQHAFQSGESALHRGHQASMQDDQQEWQQDMRDTSIPYLERNRPGAVARRNYEDQVRSNVYGQMPTTAGEGGFTLSPEMMQRAALAALSPELAAADMQAQIMQDNRDAARQERGLQMELETIDLAIEDARANMDREDISPVQREEQRQRVVQLLTQRSALVRSFHRMGDIMPIEGDNALPDAASLFENELEGNYRSPQDIAMDALAAVQLENSVTDENVRENGALYASQTTPQARLGMREQAAERFQEMAPGLSDEAATAFASDHLRQGEEGVFLEHFGTTDPVGTLGIDLDLWRAFDEYRADMARIFSNRDPRLPSQLVAYEIPRLRDLIAKVNADYRGE